MRFVAVIAYERAIEAETLAKAEKEFKKMTPKSSGFRVLEVREEAEKPKKGKSK